MNHGFSVHVSAMGRTASRASEVVCISRSRNAGRAEKESAYMHTWHLQTFEGIFFIAANDF
jgi:hypothetical protein